MSATPPDSAAADRRADLQRAPLGNQIASALRRDIFLGRLRPGTKLAQQELCEKFGTSRMPVRDALRELVYDGLLMRDGARAVVVAPLSRADLEDSFAIEGMLNGMAAQRATAHATADDLAMLDSYHRAMQESLDAGDHAGMARHNWLYHRYINRLSHSRKLIAALRVVSLDVPRDYLTELPEWGRRSNQEHGEIIAAMRAGDAARAGELMTEHLTKSGTGLADYLAAKGLEID